MKTRFSLLFQLRKSKSLQNGTTPIYLQVAVGDEVFELSTKQYVLAEKWNTAAQKVFGVSEDAKSINAYLKNMEQEVYQAHNFLIQKNQEVTAINLKNKLLGIDTTKHTIIGEFKYHNENMKKLVGKDFLKGTLDRYETSLMHTEAFLQWKYAVSDMDITKLSFEFIQNYEIYLKTVRSCNHNSAMKYLSNFKKIVHLCIKKGWLPNDSLKEFKLSIKDVKISFLTEEELAAMKEKSFPSERIAKVRDIFMFSCFTGLAYSDVKKLTPSEINKGIDGKDWIFTSRQKTDTDFRVPMLPEAVSIMNKYKDDPQCVNRDRVLPVLSNQKMNSYLKEIAKLCGIQKNLTYHLARHTFATTIALANGVPIETVRIMLGHKNLKQTQHYAKVIDIKISEDMARAKTEREKRNERKLAEA